ncbi:MAG: hypothetical protein HZB29_14195 [Nitrospinae bacterium]|nr:hypothetical protein [Nitrospinota bacterium]
MDELQNFKRWIKLLTDSSILIDDSEASILAGILKEKWDTRIDFNEFNELLLLCNKDRVSKGFFELFFSEIPKVEETKISNIPLGIESFRKYAMIGFGNFKYAYRTLSRLEKQEIQNHIFLKKWFVQTSERISCFKSRPNRIADIEKIEKDNTFLTGYLSSTNMKHDISCHETLNNAISNAIDCDNLIEILATKLDATQAHDEKAIISSSMAKVRSQSLF